MMKLEYQTKHKDVIEIGKIYNLTLTLDDGTIIHIDENNSILKLHCETQMIVYPRATNAIAIKGEQF